MPRTKDPADIAIGERIKAARNMRGFSQTELATAIGVTFQQVQKYEKGVNRVGSGRLEKVAAFLGTTVMHLHGITPNGKADGVPPILTKMMTMPGGPELAEAWTAIENREVRAALVQCARSFSQAGQQQIAGRAA